MQPCGPPPHPTPTPPPPPELGEPSRSRNSSARLPEPGVPQVSRGGGGGSVFTSCGHARSPSPRRSTSIERLLFRVCWETNMVKRGQLPEEKQKNQKKGKKNQEIGPVRIRKDRYSGKNKRKSMKLAGNSPAYKCVLMCKVGHLFGAGTAVARM